MLTDVVWAHALFFDDFIRPMRYLLSKYIRAMLVLQVGRFGLNPIERHLRSVLQSLCIFLQTAYGDDANLIFPHLQFVVRKQNCLVVVATPNRNVTFQKQFDFE